MTALERMGVELAKAVKDGMGIDESNGNEFVQLTRHLEYLAADLLREARRVAKPAELA